MATVSPIPLSLTSPSVHQEEAAEAHFQFPRQAKCQKLYSPPKHQVSPNQSSILYTNVIQVALALDHFLGLAKYSLLYFSLFRNLKGCGRGEGEELGYTMRVLRLVQK